MSIRAQAVTAIPKRASEKYKFPIIINNKRWKILTTGTVRGHEIYCHLLEQPDESRGPSIAFRACQIVDFVPLHEVFNSPDIELIERIIDFRVASCHPPEIASEICINWLILKEDGYSQEDINRAINSGIELGVLYHGYGGTWVGRTLHVH